MKAYEVSRVVNSVRNDVEECIEPLKEAPDSPQTRLKSLGFPPAASGLPPLTDLC